MTVRRTVRASLVAGLVLVWAVAFSVPPGQIGEDTKNDLYVDPWGFLARSLHLWDPQVTWGVLQNQGYGYLFPMGPWFGVVGSVLPMWLTQRLWWGLLLTVGFLGTWWLLSALGLGGQRTRAVAALAYAFSPRVLSTVGGLSSEALPVVLAPVILAPLILADRGRLSARQAALWSGTAVLCCGGVNAAATFLATLPAILWLLTRPRWWRRPVTWWWGLAALCATAWWLGPVVVLGRWSPPFMDWIETSAVVSGPISLLDVTRGTTHWLARILTGAGEWWPAAFDIATQPLLIVVTATLAALGLAGLGLPALPERRFWLWCAALGVLALALPHQGQLDSPWVTQVQAALDGPLAPLRNIHKADPLVRLPLVVGLAHLLGRLEAWRPAASPARRRALLVGAAVLVVAAALPAFTRSVATPGTFTGMPASWRAAGAWLDARRDLGTALLAPASSFGEYTWGRTIDEPLRPLTLTGYAVRDSVPLTPAGTIRLLDEVEQRLQSGRSVGGAAQVLRGVGVRWVVLRNDLDARAAGQPPVALARSALLTTPGVALAAGFGQSFQDESGARVQPVEIYDLGPAAAPVELWDAGDVAAVSGAADALPLLADAGWSSPVVFDGDRSAGFVPGQQVVTDGYRARERWFGATRGRDASASLTRAELTGTRDYDPWPDPGLRSVLAYEGVADVSASTSVADDLTFTGLRPAHRPYAAIDEDPATAWVAAYEVDPTWRLTLPAPAELADIVLEPWVGAPAEFGRSYGQPTRVRVTTDRGATEVVTARDGPTTVPLPAGATSRIAVTVLDTTVGRPAEVVTGLAEVRAPGIAAHAAVELSAASTTPADAVVVSSGAAVPDGCVVTELTTSCLAGQARTPEEPRRVERVTGALRGGPWTASGTLRVDPADPPLGLRPQGVLTRTSSSRTPSADGAAPVLVDDDARTAWSPAAGDRQPTIELTFAEPRDVDTLTLQTRRGWVREQKPWATVTVDGVRSTVRLDATGTVGIGATGVHQVSLQLLGGEEGQPLDTTSLEVEEVRVDGSAPAVVPTLVDLPCGQGPELVLDGASVPTSLTAPRAAMTRGEEVQWQACEPWEPSPESTHSTHRLSVTAPRGYLVGRTVLSAVAPRAGAPQTPLVTGRTATAFDVAVTAGAPRLLVTTTNANPGWTATVAGRVLQPQVVDGFRQGFVVPGGVGGTVQVRFAPDGAYRAALGGGGILALLLLAACVVSLLPARVLPRRFLGAASHAATTTSGPRVSVVALGSLVLGGLVMGIVGLVVAAVAVAASAALGLRRPWLPALPAGALVVVAGVAQALLAPGGVGPTWLEASSRVALLAAFVLSACGPSWSGRVPRRSRGPSPTA